MSARCDMLLSPGTPVAPASGGAAEKVMGMGASALWDMKRWSVGKGGFYAKSGERLLTAPPRYGKAPDVSRATLSFRAFCCFLMMKDKAGHGEG